VTFVDAQRGWVVGNGYGLGGTILHTTDAGLHWVEQDSYYGYPLYGVCFTDALTGWVVGGIVDELGGTYIRAIEHTSDGGASWQGQLEQYDHRPLFAVHFADAGQG
jgi:photosystem II stability/assembly factor-like uncharacterized protein